MTAMNVLFLSPFFPPNAHLYCRALQNRGAQVLAIGDEPSSRHPPAVTQTVSDYVFEPHMGDYERLSGAARELMARHGKLDRLDSNGEHWLEAEGRLRDELSVPGLSHARTLALRSKLSMGGFFSKSAIAYPPTVPVSSREQLRAFSEQCGFPLIIKPDAGSGAVDTFVVASATELEAALDRDLSRHVAQPFVSGDIVTFDGLTDATGRIIFCTSHAYDAGIMQVRQGGLDGHYYSLRELPPRLEEVGRRAVAGFEIRERFFHLEFFAQPDGSYIGLEMNVRPPGGYSTDMMSAACNIDVYDLWAAVLTGANLTDFDYSRLYYTAHAGRRSAHSYRLAHDELEQQLGETLFLVRDVPDAFAATMGNVAYLLRHRDLQALKAAVALVQARR